MFDLSEFLFLHELMIYTNSIGYINPVDSLARCIILCDGYISLTFSI